MGLQSTLLIDIPNGIQSITYTQANLQVDAITFQNNAINFSASPGFTLTKADAINYFNALSSYTDLLSNNFPSFNSARGSKLPLCAHSISITGPHNVRLNYNQTSLGNLVYNINYLPGQNQVTFDSRTLITITQQEFIVCCSMSNLFFTQLSLN